MTKDKAGNELCVDDTVAFVRRNKLELGRVIKLCPVQAAITFQNDDYAQHVWGSYSDIVHCAYDRLVVVTLS